MGEAKRKYFAANGVARSTVYDDGRLHVGVSQDVEPILDSIARDRELMRHGTNKVVGRLPAIIVEELIRRGIYYDRDAFDRWWNTTEANPWRIWRWNGGFHGYRPG